LAALLARGEFIARRGFSVEYDIETRALDGVLQQRKFEQSII
jgi:hypothetical protein